MDALLTGFNITEQDLMDYIEDNPELIGIEQVRMSRLLIMQLTSARKHRLINTFHITDVIKHLEGNETNNTLTKKGEPFNHPPLKGLWKAHYYDDHFLAKNLYNQWGLFNKKSPKFNQLISDVIKEEAISPSPYGWQGRLADKFTIDGYQNKTKSGLTGEWIIYGKENELNYYLCIAQHTRPCSHEDKELYSLINKYCSAEYPFLFKKVS